MNFLVKEVLYLLDYEDNIKETLFISTDKRTPGYAYEINIKDYNTGYSDLSFKMPCDITNEEGETIKNPKLALLVPLSKVRYNRTVKYMGKEAISVPEPDGSTKIYPEENGNRLLEDYTMDYIIQPLDKSRQGIGISLTYTAIDFPRFNLSKKKVGLTFDDKTITTQELSLYKNEPLSVPGSIQYIPWTHGDAINFQTVGQVQSYENLSSQNAKPGDYYNVNSGEGKGLYIKGDNGGWTKVDTTERKTWSPNAQAQTYPLDNDAIKKLVNETVFSYGILATIYYWPVTSSGRFQGVWYEEGGFITLSLYNTYEGSDWEGSDYLESIVHEWGHLDPMEHYLSPNNACNYLRYILKDTNWKVAGDKNLFIPKTEAQPWFDEGEAPTDGKDGNYYITYIANDKVKITDEIERPLNTTIGENTPTVSDMSEASAITVANNIIRDKKRDNIKLGDYKILIHRMENGVWVDKTGTTFEQIVNTDITDEDFGTLYDIDIEQVEVSRSAEASIGQIEYTDARYSLSVSNANCYNAITSEAKLFDLYPIFDCVNKKVSLKLNVGKDYGLSYRYKSNLKSSSVKVDGEKVITKLYVTGGTDAQGEQNITIGEANRIISGTTVGLETIANSTNYLKTTVLSQVKALEEDIYEHINGLKLSNSVDMSSQKFKLTLPDNLHETEISTTTSTTKKIIGFDSGKSINKIYNPTGKDYCYYVYIRHTKDDDYKDEKNQLYKFDGANITLRRNLEEYFLQNIGTVNYIASNETNLTNNIRYCPALSNQVKKEGNTYIGTIINNSTTEYEYTLNNIPVNESFVLIGPDRVYTVPAGETATYNYAVGNYYYITDTDSYRYCATQYIDTETAYSKINNIAVTGYVFVELGAPTKELIIKVNGVNTNLYDEDDNKLLLGDWFINDFSLRAIFDGESLKANKEFDPNAEEYLVCRSPYGTSYIYNFKYLYDNGWMAEADILDIYAHNQKLNDLNLDFYNRYTKDLVNIQAAYNDAVNNYDIYSSKADAQLEALMSQYWVNSNKASDGQFSAFPGMPADVKSSNFDTEKNKYYMDITYEEPQEDGTTKTLTVKRVYFDIFGTTSCADNYPHATDNKTTARNPYTEGQYHVVANALGWDNHREGKLTINSEIEGYTEAQDPSKTADSYNKFITQMKEYYYRAMEADKQMVETQEALEALMARYEEWEREVANIEKYLQETYGEYIIEGSYSNADQPYANLLIKDGLEASDKYATPDITYTVGVVDSSGLLEYRAPHKLICNDLVKRLHNIGQIVPRVGDYVAIQDEPMGMYGVPGLITQINRRIDNPYQNSITIDTSYTDADELVGNIITATNTVLNNKDIYGRAAIINNKGELSSTTVTNALSTGTNSINIISTNGKVAVDDNGLTCVNPHNKNEVMRYNGAGILGSNNGGATWRELLTQNGVNANYINAGTINAGKVSITDGGHDITVVNADGLIVKSEPNKAYVLGSLDANGEVSGDKFENVTVFVGKDKTGKGVGYFNGYINATKGGNIAGWSISPTRLTAGTGSKFVGISSDGNYAFWAGHATPSSAPYWVKPTGEAHFTNVLVDGNSSINGNNIQAGTINNAQIAASTITADRIVNGTITAAQLADRTITGVKIGQNVIAAEHIVANSITAGQIAANTITGSKIAAGTITGSNIAAGTINASKIDATDLWVSAAHVSGTLSAATISADNISGGTLKGVTLLSETPNGGNATPKVKIENAKITIEGRDGAGHQTSGATLEGGTLTLSYNGLDSSSMTIQGGRIVTSGGVSIGDGLVNGYYYDKSNGLSYTSTVGQKGSNIKCVNYMTQADSKDWNGQSATVPIIVAGVTTKTLYFKNGLFVGYVE